MCARCVPSPCSTGAKDLRPTHAPSLPARARPQVAFPQELAQRLIQPAAAASSTPGGGGGGGGGMNLARSAALWDPLRIEAQDVETGARYNLYVKQQQQLGTGGGGGGGTAGAVAAAAAVRLSRDGRHLVVSGLHVRPQKLTRSRVRGLAWCRVG